MKTIRVNGVEHVVVPPLSPEERAIPRLAIELGRVPPGEPHAYCGLCLQRPACHKCVVNSPGFLVPADLDPILQLRAKP